MPHSNSFLYSVNSYLAYKINEAYYGGAHYVWCAPRYNCTGNPNSSNPCRILKDYHSSICSMDKHSSIVAQNRIGLLNGVEAKFLEGVISDETREELIYIINEADLPLFRPLLYVINKELVSTKNEQVGVRDRASFFSEEVLIRKLLSNEFDIIDIEEGGINA